METPKQSSSSSSKTKSANAKRHQQQHAQHRRNTRRSSNRSSGVSTQSRASPASSTSIDEDPAVVYHSTPLTSSSFATMEQSSPVQQQQQRGEANVGNSTRTTDINHPNVDNSRDRILRNSLGLNLNTSGTSIHENQRGPKFKDQGRRQTQARQAQGNWANQDPTMASLATTNISPITIPGATPPGEPSSSPSPAASDLWDSTSPSESIYSRCAPPGYQPPPVKYPPKSLAKASITTSAPITASSSFLENEPHPGRVAPPSSPLSQFVGDSTIMSSNDRWPKGAMPSSHASLMQLQERVSSALASHGASIMSADPTHKRSSSTVSSVDSKSRRESISALAGPPGWRQSGSPLNDPSRPTGHGLQATPARPYGEQQKHQSGLPSQVRTQDTPVPWHITSISTASTPAGSRLTEHLRDLYAENLAFQGAVRSLERDINDERHRTRELTSRLAQAEADARVARLRADDFELRLGEAVDEIVRVEDEANALRQERDEILRRSSELVATRKRSGSTALATDQKAFERQLRELEKDKAALVADRGNLVDRLANSEMDKAALAGRLLIAEHDARQLGSQIAQLGQRVQESQIHIVETAARQVAALPSAADERIGSHQPEDTSANSPSRGRRYSREELLELKNSPLVPHSAPDLSRAPWELKPSSYPPQPYAPLFGPDDRRSSVESGTTYDDVEHALFVTAQPSSTYSITPKKETPCIPSGISAKGDSRHELSDVSGTSSPRAEHIRTTYVTPQTSPSAQSVPEEILASQPISGELLPERPISAPVDGDELAKVDYDADDPLHWALKERDYGSEGKTNREEKSATGEVIPETEGPQETKVGDNSDEPTKVPDEGIEKLATEPESQEMKPDHDQQK